MKIFFSFYFFFIVSCVEKPTQVSTLGKIYGTVYDDSTNSPLANCSITIADIGNRITSDDGYYEFDECCSE